MEEILSKKPGGKIILLGNEAIVRGALEEDVQFVSTYPGTPASEIGNIFYKIAKKAGIYFEFSINEKVAMESGIGASFSGLKTLIAMKNFGLNVAQDSLLPFLYTGSKGPTVIIVADDPSCHSSAQSEENSRAIAYLAHIPVLEPSDPQECKDFVKLGFQISKTFKIPVMIRETTRVAHQKMPVKLAKFSPSGSYSTGKFIKDYKKFVTLPPRVLEQKSELLEKIKKIQQFSETSSYNSIDGNRISNSKKMGVVTSGISYLYVKEALKELNLNLPVLKLGFFYPLPEKKIKDFIKGLKKVLIVEELEPFLEKEIERLAKGVNCKLEVKGKELLPEVGELKPEFVLEAIAKFTNKKFLPASKQIKLKIPKRFPQLCPGCPYWFVFNGIKKAVDPKNIVFGGDIGCYMLAGLPPHFLQDYLSCMGSSIGIAHGIKKSTKQKVITLIGDSTFFHAGIPALINTIHNQSNPLIIIMDNQTTAMTGHQPHPGIKIDDTPVVKIEDVVRACGVKNLKVIDPVNQKEFIKTIKEFLTKSKVSVIIARRPCVFVIKK